MVEEETRLESMLAMMVVGLLMRLAHRQNGGPEGQELKTVESLMMFASARMVEWFLHKVHDKS